MIFSEMEGEVAQIASPNFIHQALPMSKKRDFTWQTSKFSNNQHQFQQQQRFNPEFQNLTNTWNSGNWNWDSVMFTAKPSPIIAVEPQKKEEEPVTSVRGGEQGEENLTLKLGSYSSIEPVNRPNKRVRSGSPSNGISYPMCQVDDCKGDLSNAKDYHRRHKVCEHHSKTTHALVAKQMQRFCQQCSRFHLLSEFDEGKRSCRRRLAGHNRRRRKTQLDDVSPKFLPMTNGSSNTNVNLDLVNLLALITRLQAGNNIEKIGNSVPLPDKDKLLQIFSKIDALPISSNSPSTQPERENFDLNISQISKVSIKNPSLKSKVDESAPTMDLLAVLSTALATSSPESLAILSQRSSNSSIEDKSKINNCDHSVGLDVQMKSRLLPCDGTTLSSSQVQSTIEISDSPVQETQPILPLQLFNSSPDESPPKMSSTKEYFSSDGSNPMEDRSPSSSPPAWNLFPVHSASNTLNNRMLSTCREDNALVQANTRNEWKSSLKLFKKNSDNGTVARLHHAGYSSSSGSDQSPSTSNSDIQDRTGRIIFKLFDKDPCDLPITLRSQILAWLSHSPSEMESYIRPGCVVLSIYTSMPSFAWMELQEHLFERVNSLISSPHCNFWRSGRFMVQTDRRLVSHKNGNLRLSKSWRSWTSPEVLSVSPLAVVGGQESKLVLRGRNLTIPGTKIYCTYKGGYLSKEVVSSANSDILYNDLSMEIFKFRGGSPNVLGRCFIEVENGFKGNSFPIIIADSTICQELLVLETVFQENERTEDDDNAPEHVETGSKENVMFFLNELGWLFQKTETLLRPGSSCDFSHTRFKFLLLFSMERDWSALVKTILDIFVEINIGQHGLSKESLETLQEIHLLNKAVKRNCRKMVNLLLSYTVRNRADSSILYIFPPNLPGPGGITPLHLAACLQDSQEIVDALTSDPQEIGMTCWNYLLDANGHTPYAYSSIRGNHSYNDLVTRKLADRKNGQVSIMLTNAETSLDQSWILSESDKHHPHPPRSCSQCVDLERKKYYNRIPGSQGLLYRPYILPMLAIAAVCVCVCLLFRGLPKIGSIAPFKWENIDYGTD